MQDIIHLLPDSIANQIAAGEVVQRPASVVKELLENSLDAGATEVTLIVKDAGKALIQVIDDGKGMSETDARMSFERHATSKIRTSEDLFTVKTMGFRGEALASIAAVAQVELKTRRETDDLGTVIQIDGSMFKGQHHDACRKGTAILVKNLFFNVPARRNFLKGNPVEMRHILEEFQRIALAWPDVSFSLYQEDEEIYNLKPGKLSQRIIGIFGKNYKEQLIPCQEETDSLNLHGYVGKAENVKKSRGEQFFFVNNRFIKSSYLNHAVVSAFDMLIPDGSFPFFVLFIDIDPVHIDVNVHPTKTEIKFDDERNIYAQLKSAVRKALGSYHVTPSLDFGTDTNFNFFQSKIGSSGSLTRQERDYGQFKGVESDSGSNLQNWEKLYASALKTETLTARVINEQAEKGDPLAVTMQSAANIDGISELAKNTEQQGSVFQVQMSYIATPVKSGLMIIDQQAAHERICYERFLDLLHNNTGTSQQLLFPETVELNPADLSLVMELEQEIKGAGFAYEHLGNTTIVINGVPSLLMDESGKKVFLSVLNDYKSNFMEFKNDKAEALARSLAMNAAIKRNKKLGTTEMKSIIDRLFACKNPNNTPGGRLIYFILDGRKIEDTFNTTT
jgi:DNA mismatch repair protein MutL